MELNLLSSILRELILEHDRVSLPGMGSFIAEMAPSVFSDKAMVIHPPFRRILFRTSEVWNDGLLESRYAAERGISDSEATAEISVFVKMMKIELNSTKHYKIPDFGSMRATEQNDYFFVAEKGLFNYLEGFGLEPLNLKILNKRGAVETLTGKPTPFDIPKETEQPVREEDPANASINEEFTQDAPQVADKETQKEVQVESQKEAPEVVPIVTPLITPKEIKKSSPEEEKRTTTLADKEKLVAVSEMEAEGVKGANVGNVVKGKKVEKAEKAEKVEIVENDANDANDEKVKKAEMVQKSEKSSKFVKRFVLILATIFMIIVIVALLFIFKDEMRPFWEWLLYSKDELEILRAN
ncbi:MAG: hypothetical protein A2X19_00775 [Bacteroidetes bacterium GWE2_39_28]|nr:MAG: hypothetical protein A2X19_00775 [Bacteroidetes bacterium GWE2_39_28]OFY12424.1 MAG: hypothetical protein A2X16_10700 [Bacteroidetes bacterium GWF2_39_10]OFZ09072.1 MAG: hypothetical protein A2322_07200 [Bacteroidetes bacterium RIFOXYB2_FULL_39_7]OFZ09832.1 MAG: hypothetical protein A2465_04700 [Bacteroidetes bacterium RIFOXYC2_FULL_39_11]HCT93365.1 hypothetical protein [Rikenellaceae bacterium]